jgi:CRISPR-associated protein Cmr1
MPWNSFLSEKTHPWEWEGLKLQKRRNEIMAEFNISRYKDIEKITYECEVVTPMFLSGANQKEAELRTQSIKGALRFWWRALYGSDDIEDMKKEEGEIFGNTENKSNLIIALKDENIQFSSENLNNSGFHILNYLAYGVFDTGNRKIKKHIASDSKFKILVYIKKKNCEQIEKSLFSLINLGGLGSKARNGFGSLSSKNAKNELKFIGNLKNFTAISKEAKLYVFDEKNSWKKVLEEIGNIYKESKMELKNKSNDKRFYIDGGNSRHSKPYFLHVNKTKNEKFQGQILYMPYKYYKPEKHSDYINACNDMNKILSAKALEVKNELS